MANESGDNITNTPQLKSVHQCINCGTTCDRDDMSVEEMITGVLVSLGCRFLS